MDARRVLNSAYAEERIARGEGRLGPPTWTASACAGRDELGRRGAA
ncbi:MAG: hypothetical protein HOV86_30310 [Thermoactinospora sp.]|nr:hypothetical protein [Thermoactinospora sp.]